MAFNLPVELALKIPVDLIEKIRMHIISTRTADLIKEIFNPNLLAGRLDSRKYLYNRSKYRILLKIIINNRLFAMNKTSFECDGGFVVRIQDILIFPAHRNPITGFNMRTAPGRVLKHKMPNMTWTHKQLYTLAIGILPVVRKSWSKRKLLQVLYPNLQFI